MVNNNSELEKTIFKDVITVSLTSIISFSITYAGRSYLLINPGHALLYTAATLSLIKIENFVRALFQQSDSFFVRCSTFIFPKIPLAIVIGCQIYSPVTALALSAVGSMAYSACYTLLGPSFY